MNEQTAAKTTSNHCTTFDILRGTETVFNGAELAECAPQRENLIVIDGLLFSITGPEPGVNSFNIVHNAAGPVNPPVCGSYQFNGSGFPADCGSDRPPVGSQSTSGQQWGIHAGGANGNYGPASDGSSFLGRATRGRGIDALIGAYDFEIRFTSRGGKAEKGFQDGAIIDVPFEIWNTGIGTPNDPSDDVRMIPEVFDQNVAGVFDAGGDHAISGGANDPFTDYIYFYNPDSNNDGVDDLTPGEGGYEAYFFGAGNTGSEVWARMVLVCLNCGTAPPYAQAYPEIGTTYRITTLKPNNPGDVYTLNTGTYDANGDGTPDLLASTASDYANNADDIQRLLDGIGIVPNPYRGASSYEKSQLVDEVRFTGLPPVATIRVFTLNGTLIRTLDKPGGNSRTLSWDLTTDNLLPIASGMYLIHVDIGNGRSKVLKFAVIKKRTHLNVF
jgi:hypothetical protein